MAADHMCPGDRAKWLTRQRAEAAKYATSTSAAFRHVELHPCEQCGTVWVVDCRLCVACARANLGVLVAAAREGDGASPPDVLTSPSQPAQCDAVSVDVNGPAGIIPGVSGTVRITAGSEPEDLTREPQALGIGGVECDTWCSVARVDGRGFSPARPNGGTGAVGTTAETTDRSNAGKDLRPPSAAVPARPTIVREGSGSTPDGGSNPIEDRTPDDVAGVTAGETALGAMGETLRKEHGKAAPEAGKGDAGSSPAGAAGTRENGGAPRQGDVPAVPAISGATNP